VLALRARPGAGVRTFCLVPRCAEVVEIFRWGLGISNGKVSVTPLMTMDAVRT
jgi:hypothetical protein